MELNRFIAERETGWKELERHLERVGAEGLKSFRRDDVRRVVALYRQASSDLIEARSRLPNAELVSYLNALVARAYGTLYTTRGLDPRRILAFLGGGWCALLRRRGRYVLASIAVFAAGGLLGFAGVLLDPGAREWLVPEDHRDLDPAARVARLETADPDPGAAAAAAFSSFLFTHNIRVAFFAFALGITLGIGTVAVLFANGVMLGALAADYQIDGVSTFFWAWILPHGVPELGSIFIAGGAGLLLGKSLLFPGDLTLKQSFRKEAGDAVLLVLGTIPLFVVAGLIEGSFSQIHEPRLPYAIKLAVAALEALALFLFVRLGKVSTPSQA